MASLRTVIGWLLMLGVLAGPAPALAQPLEPPAAEPAAAPEPQEAPPPTPEQSQAIEGGLQSLFATPEAQVGPDLFGFTPVAVAETQLDDVWQAASTEALPLDSAAAQLVARVRDLPVAGKARAVNIWLNHRIAYAEDIDVYGERDHWAGLAETLERGRGDCEDFAIAKMQLLAAAGVSRREMYLVLVRNVPRESDHAVLAVRDGDDLLILDSNQDAFLKPRAASPYRPVMAYSVDGRWVFGHRDEETTVATALGAVTAAERPVPFSR